MSITKNATTGKWMAKGTVCLPDGSKRYYNRQFDLKRDAVAWEKQRREELQFESPSMTLDTFVKIQDERNAVRVKESTMYFKKSMYRTLIQPALGTHKLAEIKPVDIAGWLSDLAATYAPATCNAARAHLSSYLQEAYMINLIPENPVRKVRPIPKVHPDDLEGSESDAAENYWTPAEFERAYAVIPDFYKLPFRLLWATGMRKGELLGLTWENVLPDGSIRIRQQLARHTKKITTPKTSNSVRTISLDTKTWEMLMERKKIMQEADGFDESWFVCKGEQPLSHQTLNNQLKSAIKKTGVKSITPHGLRHSHASLLINNDVPDFLIADRLGHTVEVLHRVYAHLYDSKRKEMGDILNQIL